MNGPRSVPLATWTTLTTTAAIPGHFLRRCRFVDRPAVLCKSTGGQSSSVSLSDGVSSDQAEVAVDREAELNARRKKWATRSAVAVGLLVERSSTSRSSRLPMTPQRAVFLPANGGLPTNASNPGFSRSKTSGNSISQWNGTMGCVPPRRSHHGRFQPIVTRPRRIATAGPRGHRPVTPSRSFRFRSLSAAKNAETTRSP